ncbi:MAG: hypothetical protein Q7K35_03305, partial [bacterium]|nr:hypothetical protein [bacterium]
MKQESVIKALGYKLSATVLSIAGATGKKLAEKFLVSLPNRGQTTWKGQKEQRGQPAFDLAYLPGLFLDALRLIMAQGFDIAPDGVISGSVRPYDLVIANTNGVPLMPALSSECNAATEEVEYLRDQGVEEVIGRLEPQMALPKLLWALKQHPALKEKIGTVMTTG